MQNHLGTAANDVHFQAYVLEGIVRWNSQISKAALLKAAPVHLTQLCRSAILNKSTDTDFYPPAAYTGELFRIENLYSEMGSNLTMGSNIDTEIEEGLNNEDHLVTFAEEEGSLDSELDVAARSS